METSQKIFVRSIPATGAGLQGLAAGVLVRSLAGVIPVEFLEPGDRIVTRSGAQKLVSLSVSERRNHALVRIRASTLGHDRPEQDLLVGPDQPILIRDWRARVLYGAEQAVIPACRLVDGEFVVVERQRQTRLFTLRFADSEVVYAEGIEIACDPVEVDLPAQ
jgi:hypothetical protein